MRLQAASVETIRRVVRDEAGAHARVRLFGSRLDDAARGGDVDLLVAWLVALREGMRDANG